MMFCPYCAFINALSFIMIFRDLFNFLYFAVLFLKELCNKAWRCSVPGSELQYDRLPYSFVPISVTKEIRSN